MILVEPILLTLVNKPQVWEPYIQQDHNDSISFQNQPTQQDIPPHADTESQPQELYYQAMSHTDAMLTDDHIQHPFFNDIETPHLQYAPMYYTHCNVTSWDHTPSTQGQWRLLT